MTTDNSSTQTVVGIAELPDYPMPEHVNVAQAVMVDTEARPTTPHTHKCPDCRTEFACDFEACKRERTLHCDDCYARAFDTTEARPTSQAQDASDARFYSELESQGEGEGNDMADLYDARDFNA